MRERVTRLSLRLGAPLGVGLVLGLIGPFGTFDMLPVGTRLAYWLCVVSANWLLADAIVRQFDALAGDRLPFPGLLVPLTGALLASVPATGVVALANGLSGIGWPQNVPVLFGQVLLLLAAICLPAYAWEDMQERIGQRGEPALADRPPDSSSETDAPQQDNGLTLFTARLPAPIDGRLLCLEMQDHYLVVHSAQGSVMILCRMEDAARELDRVGQRVHRSWWVASEAVAGTEREGQRVFLRLSDARRVPVGRSYQPKLRAAGWL